MPIESNPRAATEMDRFIGAQIRIRRASAGLSQEALAEAIGVTFQQVQKYEKGVNRVSAATLFRIAGALEVTASDLMPGGATIGAGAKPDVETIAALAHPISRLNAQGRELLLALAQTLAAQTSLRG